MKYYTGQGDAGLSVLLGEKKKIPKSDARFEALGAMDELNSYLGICASLTKDGTVKKILNQVQENLFIIQSELGGSKKAKLEKIKIKEMEETIDALGNFVGPITKFTIAGGDPLSAHLDYARVVARKAERAFWTVNLSLGGPTAKYLNRLSSLLFVLARYVNKKANISENHPKYK